MAWVKLGDEVKEYLMVAGNTGNTVHAGVEERPMVLITHTWVRVDMVIAQLQVALVDTVCIIH